MIAARLRLRACDTGRSWVQDDPVKKIQEDTQGTATPNTAPTRAAHARALLQLLTVQQPDTARRKGIKIMLASSETSAAHTLACLVH